MWLPFRPFDSSEIFRTLDHTRSEHMRRLIARDPAHARPEGRGLRFLSPVYRPRACALSWIYMCDVRNFISQNLFRTFN